MTGQRNNGDTRTKTRSKNPIRLVKMRDRELNENTSALDSATNKTDLAAAGVRRAGWGRSLGGRGLGVYDVSGVLEPVILGLVP